MLYLHHVRMGSDVGTTKYMRSTNFLYFLLLSPGLNLVRFVLYCQMNVILPYNSFILCFLSIVNFNQVFEKIKRSIPFSISIMSPGVSLCDTAEFRSDNMYTSTVFTLLLNTPVFPDMSIFGLYPGHDDFYLVVCSHCGQVVKPQAFEKHCERRHGPLGKLYARLRSPTPAPQPQQRSHHSHSPSHGTNAASASSWEGRGQGVGQLRAAPPSPSTPPQYRHAKSSKDVVR